MYRQRSPPSYTDRVRVIAGRYRRRILLAPPGLETRPILDRVKTALFDWLGARFAMPGQLPPMRVLDLFCGGGSLGIEALSRGAAYCAFVEREPQAVACLMCNLDDLGIGPAGRVHRGLAEGVRIDDPGADGFDLVFLDPPYRMSEAVSPGSTLYRVLCRLGSDIRLAPDAVIVWRHDAQCEVLDAILDWRMLDRRSWGGMTVTLFQRSAQVTS